MDTPKYRALRPKEREFVKLIVYSGLERAEAYSRIWDISYTDENMKMLKRKSTNLFFRENVNAYYSDLMEEVRDRELDKAVWTKEIATEKLMNLIARAERDLYGDNETGDGPKPLTMSRVNAVVLPAKELNLMHGFNQTNLNMDGCKVTIVGEDKIPD